MVSPLSDHSGACLCHLTTDSQYRKYTWITKWYSGVVFGVLQLSLRVHEKLLVAHGNLRGKVSVGDLVHPSPDSVAVAAVHIGEI